MLHLTHKGLRLLWLFLAMACAMSLHANNPDTRHHSHQNNKQAHTHVHKGKASYYSRRADGSRTSSGVRLDNDSLVCAHRTHPFGTLLLVRNPANGKEVVVKVIDRGPHGRGRLIDLSYEAARQLGILADGVAMVEVSVYQDTHVPFKAPAYELPELDIDITHPEWTMHAPLKGENTQAGTTQAPFRSAQRDACQSKKGKGM